MRPDNVTTRPVSPVVPWAAHDIKELGHAQTHPKGLELSRQGAMPDEVVYLGGGIVKLVRVDRDGCENILDLAFPGAWLGAAALIARTRHPVTAVTCTRTLLTRIPADVFRRLLTRHPALSSRIHQMHAYELCRQTRRMSQLSAFTSRQRLQQAIRQLIAAFHLPVAEGSVRLRSPLRQWELARLIAITPEHLSRLFKTLEREGILRRERGWLIVPDVGRLCPDGEDDGVAACDGPTSMHTFAD